MALKSFSSADAKSIVADYTNFKRMLAEIHEHGSALRGDLDKQIDKINNDPLVLKSIEDHLNGDSDELPCVEQCKEFVRALIICTEFSEAEEACNAAVNEVSRKIESNLNLLKKAASSLRWMFLGATQKTNAENAYSEMIKWEEGRYGNSILSSHKLIGRHIDTEEALRTLKNYPNRYYTYLNKSLRQAAPVVAPAKDLVIKQNNIAQRARRAEQFALAQSSETRAAILNQINKLASMLTFRQLENMDIEQLGKVKSGIRLKTLRDAGYASVADVYVATMSNLASVNGISMDAAGIIKDAATEIANGIGASVKIRLSADDRNEAATTLVNLTCQYRHIAETVGKLDKYIADIIVPTEKAILELRPLSCNAVYIALPSKHEFQNAYRSLLAMPSEAGNVVDEALYPIKITNEAAWDDFISNTASYNTLLQELVPGLFGEAEGKYGLPEELAREIQEQVFFPDGLKVTLRRYQEWGVKYALHQGKIILGDEMGLGKTVQALATMVSLKNTGANHFLVICPAGVLPNWCKEIEKKSEFHPTRIHGETSGQALEDWKKTGGVAVTTYETAIQIGDNTNFHFDLLVVDEAHYIKNRQAQRSKAVLSIAEHAERIIFLTGTPLENKVEEMISLVDALDPLVAMSLQSISYMSTARLFREKVAPVYYRRKREDVLQELPEKQEIEEYVSLFPEERELYKQALLRKDRTAICRVSWEIAEAEKSSKARRLLEIVKESADEGRRVLVFSFYKDTLRMIQHILGDSCAGMIDGSVPIEARQNLIDRFEKMPGGSVLLAQINAGGTGLNIQSASVVIICEPQLKPSIEDQAISRAYRMGQARKVLVFRLIASNTIDERITDMLDEKRKAFLAFADKSAAAEATQKDEVLIEDKTLGKLIQEEIDRINMETGFEPRTLDLNSASTIVSSIDVTEDEAISNTSANSENDDSILSNFTEPAEQLSEARPRKTVTSQLKDSDSFADADALIRYMNDEGIEYIDKREKNGCLWIPSTSKADPFLRGVKIDGRKLGFSESARALGKRPGWYVR